MQAVAIDDAGECIAVSIKQNRTGAYLIDRKKMHLHHRDDAQGLILLSPHEPRSLQCDSTPLFECCLPPPLNAHVYPSPLYTARVDASGAPIDLTPAEFVLLCESMDAKASEKEETVAVYDVPAVPFDEIEADEVDYLSDVEREEDNDESDDEDEDEDEDEEEDDWELDDDEGATHMGE